jgi:DNA-binding CsgD family transcriptional regulator
MTESKPHVSPLLVGRDDVLDLVERRATEAAAGHGQFLLLTGEPGIGKTRLVAAIRQAARARGTRIMQADIAPQDRDVPAALIMDLARTAAGTAGFEPLGHDLLALRDAVETTEHTRRRMLVVDVVERIKVAIDAPTVIVFEDLQWSDELSLEIVADLARSTRDRSLLLVGTYRSDEALAGTSLRDWRSRLVTQRIAEEIRLVSLDLAQTALVTTLILDTGLPAPREVVSAVYERTDGIPLHIEELLGAMSAQARADGRAIRDASVPETIEDAVLERIGRCSPEAQGVIRAGAVIGRCFVPDVLAGIMDVRPETLDEPMQELIDHGVLVAAGPHGLVDFRHQLLRDAVYRSVSLADRRRFHARAGEFGAQLEGQSEIHSSLHFERAGLRKRAYETALSGARDAARLSAHREAFELYRRAVANVPEDLSAAERGALLMAFGDEAHAIEENDRAEEAYLASATAFHEAGELVKEIEAKAGVLAYGRRMGRPMSVLLATGDRLLLELDALPVSAEAIEARANLLSLAAFTHIDTRELEAARADLEQIRQLTSGLDDPEWPAIVDWKLAEADFFRGDVAGAVTRLRAVAHAAEDAGYESTGVSAYRDAATMATMAMDYPEAVSLINAGLRYADSIEQSYCAHVMTATSAIVSWAGAEWADASELARQAMADRGCRRGAETARFALASVALGHGDLQAAEAEFTAVLRFGEASEGVALIMQPQWGLAEVALQAGDPERAMTICRDAFDRATATGERILLVPMVVTGVRAALGSGRPADASAWLDACAAHLAPIESLAAPALEHGRGLVALSDGATGVARTALEAAVRGWGARGRVWEATWARLDLAQCLVRSNRFAEALALAVDARGTASRLDSPALAARADTLQRMARGRVADEEPWRPLTAREYAVARLIAEGHTNAEIADVLGIAPKTASSHVEHILAKLGASRRAEIASWASHVERSALVH